MNYETAVASLQFAESHENIKTEIALFIIPPYL